MTDLDLMQWVADASPGDAIEYHRGFLLNDAFASAKGKTSEGDEMMRIRGLRDVAFDMHMRGLIELTQRRIGDYEYSYLATARRKPRIADPDPIAKPSRGHVR
jgi:hypothetical protein